MFIPRHWVHWDGNFRNSTPKGVKRGEMCFTDSSISPRPDGISPRFCSLRLPIRTPKDVTQNCWLEQPLMGRIWIRGWIVQPCVSPAFNGLEHSLRQLGVRLEDLERVTSVSWKSHPRLTILGVKFSENLKTLSKSSKSTSNCRKGTF